MTRAKVGEVVELRVVRNGDTSLALLVYLLRADLVALMHVDLQFLQLLGTYPKYACVDAVDKDDVRG